VLIPIFFVLSHDRRNLIGFAWGEIGEGHAQVRESLNELFFAPSRQQLFNHFRKGRISPGDLPTSKEQHGWKSTPRHSHPVSSALQASVTSARCVSDLPAIFAKSLRERQEERVASLDQATAARRVSARRAAQSSLAFGNRESPSLASVLAAA
jgi:hypothetical protein